MSDRGIFAAVTKDCELTYTGPKFICVCKKDGYLSQCAALGARMRIVLEAYEATKTKENETMSTPSAYVAEYHGRDGLLTPYGFGKNREIAMHEARHKFAGASAGTKAFILCRIKCRPLTADEASEVAEYFAKVW
jgi:hypothetical protein